MGVGIRTHELRKVFTTPPPLAAAGARFAGGGGGGLFKKKKDAKPNPNIVALDGVSLEVAPGEIFGLLGPNGAGKSTTVGILTTRVRPTSGEAYIGPYDAWKQQVDAKRLIGVVQQRPPTCRRGRLSLHAACPAALFRERLHSRQDRS